MSYKDVIYMLNRKRVFGAVVVIALFAGLGALAYRQKISGFIAGRYEIKGIDVSHHQNEIEWKNVPEHGIDFAYIKATEGSSWVDDRLEFNYEGARENGMDYGFYHFVSFESSPEDQLNNFKAATKDYEMTLIPALDAEYYGDMEKNPLPRDQVLAQIRELETIFRDAYGVYPLIYTTQKFYYRYLRGQLDDYPVWIRNVYYLPTQKWAVWQYTDKLKINGIGTSVDGNVTGRKKFEQIKYSAK